MNRHRFALSLFALTLSATAGCANLEATFFKPKDSMALVDELSARVEQVHVASEVSKVRMRAAIDTLHGITSPEFRGDGVAAYAELTRAIDQSEDQAEELRSSVARMKDTAQELFERWASDLEEFTNAEMRQRSQLRLEATRSRYETVLAAIEPAQWSYDAVNRSLRDHALFLGHDFNRESVSEISAGVDGLAVQAADLETRLVAGMTAAKDYVDSAAHPGQVAAEPAQ